jgi:hypothetical protein
VRYQVRKARFTAWYIRFGDTGYLHVDSCGSVTFTGWSVPDETVSDEDKAFLRFALKRVQAAEGRRWGDRTSGRKRQLLQQVCDDANAAYDTWHWAGCPA